MSKTKKETQSRDWWNLGLNTITGFTVNERGKIDKETTENYNANRRKKYLWDTIYYNTKKLEF